MSTRVIVNVGNADLDNAQSQEEQSRQMQSIYKVPPLISDLNKNAYQPQAVSLGPYHHGEPHLMPMEGYKQQTLTNFLRESLCTKEEILESMVEVAKELKDSYSPLAPEWRDNTTKFMGLMIVDGCFILEILLKADLFLADLGKGDSPLFSQMQYAIPFIKRDMLLLENQLPMRALLVLLKFHASAFFEGYEETLTSGILSFFERDDVDCEIGECLHILDFYRKSLLYQGTPTESHNSKQIWGLRSQPVIRSATELKAYGISFKKMENKGLMDISFDRGDLSLPKLVIDHTTESTFLNLIAFERCHIEVGCDITSFIRFMGLIVKQGRDINLLSSQGIIHNVTSSDKAAAVLFNNMSKELIMEPVSDLIMVYQQIDDHCKKRWNSWLAVLIETHFSSPWKIISLVAAVILLALTVLQTGFSGYDVTH